MNKKLLIVEDNEEVRRQLRWGFSDEGYTVLQADNVDAALAIQAREHPQVITLDLGLPPDPESNTEGYRGLAGLLSRDPQCKIIVVTGHHDTENARRCIQNGAYDFCRKPVNLEELKVIVRRAFFLHEMASVETDPEPENSLDICGIITQCDAMRNMLGNLPKVAASDVPVLITGDSGTGKELVAQAIHKLSKRRNKEMISINCGAIPENLMESELFGHEKGAFTGAVHRVPGKAELADNSTLFLDEIGELPPLMQVKLLRFLQAMVIQRIGGRQDIPVNVRIVAATNVDLAAAMREGQFREDLYYRLGVVNIAIPSLQARDKDVLLLADYFIRKYDEQGRIRGLHPVAERAMLLHSWPGNVRELENKIRRAIIYTDGPYIKLETLELSDQPASTYSTVEHMPQISLHEARSAVERKLLVEALSRHSGNIMQAAQSIGISRPTFYDLMKKHQIEQ